jgi:hypothetical protein
MDSDAEELGHVRGAARKTAWGRWYTLVNIASGIHPRQREDVTSRQQDAGRSSGPRFQSPVPPSGACAFSDARLPIETNVNLLRSLGGLHAAIGLRRQVRNRIVCFRKRIELVDPDHDFHSAVRSGDLQRTVEYRDHESALV